jgi:gas vesicle protein
MNNSRAIVASALGAVVGAVAAYLFFTDEGKALRRQLEPAIEDFSRELSSLRASVEQATGAASESWTLLTDTLGESAPRTAGMPYAGSRQTSPF